MTEGPHNLQMTVYASLFAALTAVGAFISIPVGPVPIVMQNFFVMLSGLLLGSRWGLASVSVYLLAGILGLPVFAGGSGGIGRMLGPTGGYLVGYLPAVWIVGMVSRKPGPRLFMDVSAMIIGSIVVYTFGVAWLKQITGMAMMQTLAVGMFPFLPGDALKIAAAVPVARGLRKVIHIPNGRKRAAISNAQF